MNDLTAIGTTSPQPVRAKRSRLRFGFDAFIAYNRGSAATYARKLFDTLTSKYSLVCNIDVVGFKPGTRLRPRTILSLALSHMLIVVFTRQAQESVYVRREVSLFLFFRKWLFWNRPISILDVEGDWRRLLELPSAEGIERPWTQLREETHAKMLLYETETDFASGPTAAVCARYGEWKAFERLRARDIRVVVGSIILAVVLAVAAIVSLFTLKQAQAAAAIADRSRNSAVALKLGAQAREALSQPYGLGVETAVLLGVESANREANVDAHRAVMDGLALLPRPIRTVSISKDARVQPWLSPNGRYVLFRQPQGIEVKRAENGMTVGIIRQAKGPASVISFSTEGEFVLLADVERGGGRRSRTQDSRTILRVFRLADVTEVGSARFAGELSGNGTLGPNAESFAVTLDAGNGVLFGRFETRGQFVTIPSRASSPFAASFPVLSGDGRFLAIVRAEKDQSQVRIWSTASLLAPILESRKPGVVISRPAEVRNAAFSPDGRLLATSEETRGGSTISTLRLWSTTDGLEQIEPILHPKHVRTIAFSPDGTRLATEDGQVIRVWTTNGVLSRVDERDGLAGDDGLSSDDLPSEEKAPFGELSVAPAAVSNGGLTVLRKRNKHYPQDSVDEYEIFDVEVDFYSFESARSRLVVDVLPEGNPGRVASVSREGRRVVVGTDRGVVLYAADGSATPVALSQPPVAAAFSQDGEWLVVVGESKGSQDVALTLIRSQDGQQAWHGSVPTVSPYSDTSVSVSNTGIVAASIELEAHHPGENVFVFDPSSGAKRSFALGSPPPEYSSDHPDGWVWPGVPGYWPPVVSISPDGRFLLMGDEILNAVDGSRAFALPSNFGSAVGYEPNGRRVYLEKGKTFRIWDPQTGAMSEQQFRLQGSVTRDGEMSVMPEGEWIWVYRTRDGAPLGQVAFGGELLSATLSADGRTIISSGKDARLRTFRWQPDDLIRVAQEYVTRPLSDSERDQYLLSDVTAPSSTDTSQPALSAPHKGKH